MLSSTEKNVYDKAIDSDIKENEERKNKSRTR